MKKLITIATVVMAAMFAKADVFLYWTADVGGFTGATAAQLYGESNGTYSLIETVLLGQDGAMNPSNANLGISASPYLNYLVKLYSGALASLNEIATSDAVSTEIEALTAAIWNNGSSDHPTTNPYSFSGFTASIPEPTSGLLMLLGLGALALKRSRLR